MLKTFKYRLYPSKNQEHLPNRTLETCRRWYNICLGERKDAWEQEKCSVGKFQQLAKVKTYRKENPYAGQVHSHVLQVVTADLDKAFAAFFRRVKAGEKAGYPRFRGEGRFDSFGFKEYGNGFKLDGRRLRLSGIGRVAVRWHRPIEGQIKVVRIRRQPGHPTPPHGVPSHGTLQGQGRDPVPRDPVRVGIRASVRQSHGIPWGEAAPACGVRSVTGLLAGDREPHDELYACPTQGTNNKP